MDEQFVDVTLVISGTSKPTSDGINSDTLQGFQINVSSKYQINIITFWGILLLNIMRNNPNCKEEFIVKICNS